MDADPGIKSSPATTPPITLVPCAQDVAMLWPAPRFTPLSAAGSIPRQRSSAAGSSNYSNSTPVAGIHLPGIRIRALTHVGLSLPPHLRDEAIRLRALAAEDNPLSEPTCRPLVHSTGIWLARVGVLFKQDYPHVVEKVGELLYDEKLLPMSLLAVAKGKHTAIPFADRIKNFLINYPRRTDADGKRLLVLEVPHDMRLWTRQARFLRQRGTWRESRMGWSLLRAIQESRFYANARAGHHLGQAATVVAMWKRSIGRCLSIVKLPLRHPVVCSCES